MPELPEVESVCRIMRRVLVGRKIAEVEVVPDTIVFGSTPPEVIGAALACRTVRKVGRKGKTWWLELDEAPALFGHLGMSGWIREIGAPTVRLKEHGEAPLDDENNRPRFLKLLIETEEGKKISFTDGRRLGRIWLSEDPRRDPKLAKLGPDALEDLPRGPKFKALFEKRTAPIKALLMDQSILSGIGNWVADEVLYHARINPARPAGELSTSEYTRLRGTISMVLETAVDLGADDSKYPEDWLFHHRWGGGRGRTKIGKHDLVRTTVGGRTTAWVPKLQK